MPPLDDAAEGGAQTPSAASDDLQAGNTPEAPPAKRARRGAPQPAQPPAEPSAATPQSPAAAAPAPTLHERAKLLLHVGSTPTSLPCRSAEYQQVLDWTADAVQAGTGSCAYICGVPGTGKTATVRAAIRALHERMERRKLPRFSYLEINGMKLAGASQAYTELWAALGGGKRLHPRGALTKLSAHFTAGAGARGQPTVVLMDELDLFVTSRQDVIYNLFHWPNLPGSNLVVIAVANTMDLPERTLQPKVASRLGMTRIPFMPYTDRQLLAIAEARLEAAATPAGGGPAAGGAAPPVFRPDALVFASKRVANVSGDARRMLDVCRRAVELAEELAGAGAAPAPITIGDVRSVLDAMARSGRSAHIGALPLHAKALLASMLSCVRRTGLTEVTWGDVLAHHTALCRTHSLGTGTVSDEALLRPLATLCALGVVVAVGAGAGSARAGPHARFLVAVQEDEVRLAMEHSADRRLTALF